MPINPSTRILSALAGITASISLLACGQASIGDPGPPAHRAASATVSHVASSADVASALAANASVHSASLDVDAASAQAIELGETGTEITSPGVYRLWGTAGDGQITVNSAGSGVVYLILDGVNVSSSTSSALNVAAADEVVIVLAEGSVNTLSDSATYTTGEDGPSGALYSSANLTITGSGSLTVNGNYNDGIVGKDGLVIEGGAVTVNAVDDGIRGKDYLAINGGTITVAAGGDALKSDNSEDPRKGFVVISDGALNLTAGDDGVTGYTDTIIGGGTTTVSAAGDGLKSNTSLVVGGGSITVTRSKEGLESNAIAIVGGTVNLTSSDDAVNASASDTSTETPSLVIRDGLLSLDAEGDGIDVNGVFEMSGGTVTVHGPAREGNAAIDVDSAFTIRGGTLLAGGAAGMVVTPSVASEQGWVILPVALSAGQMVEVKDSSGAAVVTYRAEKNAASLLASAAGIVNGSGYEIYVDGNKVANITAGQGGQAGPVGMGGHR